MCVREQTTKKCLQNVSLGGKCLIVKAKRSSLKKKRVFCLTQNARKHGRKYCLLVLLSTFRESCSANIPHTKRRRRISLPISALKWAFYLSCFSLSHTHTRARARAGWLTHTHTHTHTQVHDQTSLDEENVRKRNDCFSLCARFASLTQICTHLCAVATHTAVLISPGTG